MLLQLQRPARASYFRLLIACCLSIAMLPTLARAAAQPAEPTPAQYTAAIGLTDRYDALVDRQPSAPVWVDAQRFLYRRGSMRQG